MGDQLVKGKVVHLLETNNNQPEVGMRKFALNHTAIGRHHVKRQFSGKLGWIRN